MKYEIATAKEAFDISPHRHLYVNPYVGCSMGCPYCYWLSNDGWEGKIQARPNITELLREALKTWPKDEFLYLGSVCDPFNELEGKFGLTHKCLEIIRDNGNPLLITSSAVQPNITAEIDLLLEMKDRLIIAVELARPSEIERMKACGDHLGISSANKLKEAGLKVYTTMAPICPGIIELEDVIDKLRPDIPIYIDKLGCKPGSIQAERTLQWVKNTRPDLLPVYEKICIDGDNSYFNEVMEKYPDRNRIKLFPYEM